MSEDITIDDQSAEAAQPIDEQEMFGDRAVRWYQVAVKHAVEEVIERKAVPRVLIVLPTGSGKTVTTGSILISPKIRKALAKPGKPLRVLFIAHKHRLLSQAEAAYAAESGIKTVTKQTLQQSTMYRPVE